jgi:hypothetical protein
VEGLANWGYTWYQRVQKLSVIVANTHRVALQIQDERQLSGGVIMFHMERRRKLERGTLSSQEDHSASQSVRQYVFNSHGGKRPGRYSRRQRGPISCPVAYLQIREHGGFVKVQQGEVHFENLGEEWDVQVFDKIFNRSMTGEVILVPELAICVRVSPTIRLN